MLRSQLDAPTDPWGIKVTAVEMKAVELPESMKRAMAKQAEAERERRAKVIAADGEFQASEKLAQAAGVIAQQPERAAAALPPDAERDLRREELHHRVPAAPGDPALLRRAGEGEGEGVRLRKVEIEVLWEAGQAAGAPPGPAAPAGAPTSTACGPRTAGGSTRPSGRGIARCRSAPSAWRPAVCPSPPRGRSWRRRPSGSPGRTPRTCAGSPALPTTGRASSRSARWSRGTCGTSSRC